MSQPAAAPMGILERRRIEAEIIKPIYEEMKAAFGEAAAKGVIERAVKKAAVEAGRHAPIDVLIEDNVPLARSMAARYRNRGIDLDDLEQVALLGLTKAAQRFDPDAGHDFLSYAVPTIRGELRRHFRDAGWMVRPPRRVQDLQARIAKTVDYLGTFSAEDIDGSEERQVELKIGGREIAMPGMRYLLDFAMPNFYFHVTTAYDILRHNGVPLGKVIFIRGS